MLHIHSRYLRKLERDGLVNRRLEFLPVDKALAERRQAGLGPDRARSSPCCWPTPSWWPTPRCSAPTCPTTPTWRRGWCRYFPSPLRERFRAYMDPHPLRREIITTAVVNELVNRSGTTFMFRIGEETGASAPDIVRAYLVAREVFDMPSFWRAVEALDNQVDTATQIAMLLEARKLAERGARWLLHNRRPPFDMAADRRLLRQGRDGAARRACPSCWPAPTWRPSRSGATASPSAACPTELAEQVAMMVPAYSTFDLVEIARRRAGRSRRWPRSTSTWPTACSCPACASGSSRCRATTGGTSMARSALRDDLYAAHAALTRDVLVTSEPGLSPEERLARLGGEERAAVHRATQTLSRSGRATASTSRRCRWRWARSARW